jgi:hypothetical protein
VATITADGIFKVHDWQGSVTLSFILQLSRHKPHYGELPEEWEVARISELCILQNGKAFKPTDWEQEGLPIVRIQNLNDNTAPYNYYRGAIGDNHHLFGGELLFAWSGTPGTSFGAHIWNGGDYTALLCKRREWD